MATNGGPKTKTEGLVFGYDTGYPLVSGSHETYRFNKGEPTTNLITNSGTSNTGWVGYGWTGEQAISNDYSNTYEFTATNGWHNRTFDTGVTSGGTIQVTFEYKLKQQETTQNQIFVLNGTHLGSYTNYIGNGSMSFEWQTFNGTFTANADSKIAIGPRGSDSSGLTDIVYIRNLQVEVKDHATPFIQGTRSVSGSLIDLTRTTDIDLSNVSFDSNAQMTFDGTDDSILLTPRVQYSTGSAWTAELIFEPTTTDSWNGIFGGHLNAGGYWMFHNNQNLTYYEGSSAVSGTRISYKSWSIGNTFTLNQDHHLTITYTPTTAGSGSFALYYNGGEKVDTFDYGFYWAHSLDMKKIGSGDSSRYGTNNIKIFKFYNIALSAEEVKQNYNAIKSRFGLT